MKVTDGNWTLFSHDVALGRTVWHYFDGQQNHYRTDYVVDDTVDNNKLLRNMQAGQRFGEGKAVASIPLNVYYDKLEEASKQGDRKYIKRWLNDGDNAAFRTFEGRV